MPDDKNLTKYISSGELYEFLDDMPTPVVLTETDGTIRYANKQALKLGEYENLTGKKCTDTFCKNQKCTCPVNGNTDLQNSVQSFLKSDKTEVPVLKTAHVANLQNDYFVVQFFTDLREQQKKEKQLKKIIHEKNVAVKSAYNESQKFEFLFENVNDALYLHDLDGNIKKVNHTACKRLGYTKTELESMHLAKITSPRSGLEIPKKLAKIIRKRQHFFESDDLCKDGTRIPVEVSARLIELEGETLILSSARDISTRKEYEQQLLEAKKLTEYNETELKTIFNKVPSVIFIFDEKSRIQRVNEKGKEWFNLVNGNYKDLLVGDVINCIYTNDKTIKCGSSQSCGQCELSKAFNDIIQFRKVANKKEISIQIKKNNKPSNHTILLSTAVLKNNGTNLFIATLDDITDRKQMETELMYAKEKAEIAEKLKTSFLNNISHEIRTPLNGLLGFLDFFEGDLTQVPVSERKKFVEIMRKSGERLVNTVTDIIEASKIDSGILDISKENFKLGEMLELLTRSKFKKLPNHNVDFTIQIDPLLKKQNINTDKSKLLRVLQYLLDNAFKFTLKGSVTVEIKKNNHELFFAVQDTGIGIAPEDIKVIFDPFRQADIGISRAFDGNGLGLTIAHKLVKYMGGELRVDSEKGKGSRFYFSLPKIFIDDSTMIEDSANVETSNKTMTRKKILIAEDDEINYLFLQAVLEKQGYQLIHAVNGKEAVELVEKNKHFDLIIMDLKMPVMNGIEATFKIKEIDNKIPIIAHSAYVLNNEREQSLAAGCNDYLPKPVKVEDLLKTVEKHLVCKN